MRVWRTLNLAASGESDATLRETRVKDRKEAAAKMTPAQIAEAQRMASEWVSEVSMRRTVQLPRARKCAPCFP